MNRKYTKEEWDEILKTLEYVSHLEDGLHNFYRAATAAIEAINKMMEDGGID